MRGKAYNSPDHEELPNRIPRTHFSHESARQTQGDCLQMRRAKLRARKRAVGAANSKSDTRGLCKATLDWIGEANHAAHFLSDGKGEMRLQMKSIAGIVRGEVVLWFLSVSAAADQLNTSRIAIKAPRAQHG